MQYNFEEPVSEASSNSITVRALRECKFNLKCVEASVRERDDGGPLAAYSQMIHANELRSTERLCRHQIYLNHFRCRRASPYSGCIRVLHKMMCSSHQNLLNNSANLTTRIKGAFSCGKPYIVGGLFCQGVISSS